MNEIDNLKPSMAAGQGETYSDFQTYKRTFDSVLLNTANNFVRIGYLLKYARDTDILKESEHKSLVEFAKAEYGLDKTQVSRFIGINDRFSKGGYSDTLEDRYAAFGYAKLSIMLTLPEEIAEELSPDMTKSEITELKKEIDEENRISDVEVLLEEKEEQAAELTETALVIRELVKSYPKLYKSLHSCIASERTQEMPDILAPNGKDLYIVRIAGLGKFSVTAEKAVGVNIVNIRTCEKKAVCWMEVMTELRRWFDVGAGAEASWKEFFGTTLEHDEKPAEAEKSKGEKNFGVTDISKVPVMQPKETGKTEEKKTSRLHKPERSEKKEEPKTETVKAEEEIMPAPTVEDNETMTNKENEKAIPEVTEPEVGVIGKLKVAPVQQEGASAQRMVEEIDPRAFNIDPSAVVEKRIVQTEAAIRAQARTVLMRCEAVSTLMGEIEKGTSGNYESYARERFRKAREEMRKFELLMQYMNDVIDEGLN